MKWIFNTKLFQKRFFILNGFTLAEVLITLGIIGVVAAITIPTLMNNTQEAQFKTGYKKAFSVASQAWQSAYADNMMEARSGWVADISNYDNFVQFMAKFDVVKTCTGSLNSVIGGCWAPNETVDTWWGAPFQGFASQICFVDKSGMNWCNSGSWGEMFVDTNGFQKPNIYGQDRWALFTCVGIDKPDASGYCSTPGIPNTIKPSLDRGYNQHTCPMGATHPCNDTSWLYN